jgi:hypothetical protein
MATWVHFLLFYLPYGLLTIVSQLGLRFSYRQDGCRLTAGAARGPTHSGVPEHMGRRKLRLLGSIVRALGYYLIVSINLV